MSRSKRHQQSQLRRIRTLLDNDDFRDRADRYIDEQVHVDLEALACTAGEQFASEFNVDPKLASLAVAGLIRKSMRNWLTAMVAEARRNGYTLQEIADALEFASNSHVKRAFPRLVDEIARRGNGASG